MRPLTSKPLHCLAAILLITGTTASAEVFESPETRTSLLELYTSEGCSSCPPADRWLSKLKDHPRLWKDLVPVAFHVDYWDYIGWKDRYSKPEYSQRQRRFGRELGLSTIYTPGLILNGKEWRYFSGLRKIPRPAGDKVGKLVINRAAGDVTATFSPSAPVDGKLELNLALLGFDIKTDVRAGENRGRVLEHDFVVIAHRKEPLTKTPEGYSFRTGLPASSTAAPRVALVAWVSRKGTQAPIQATGGWLLDRGQAEEVTSD